MWSWFFKRSNSWLAGVLICGVLGACSHSAPFIAQSSVVYRSEPLGPLVFDEWVRKLVRYDVILLGEKHDSLRHHQAQLALIQRLQNLKKINAVVLEMIPTTQQSAFAQAQSRVQSLLAENSTITADGIEQALQWPPEWDWKRYRSLVGWLLQNRVPMCGGNLDKNEIATILRGAQPLKGRISTSPRVQQALAQLLDGHQAASDSHLQALVQAQQFKDRRMAQTLVESSKPAILLAGNMHVSKTVGVPLHLQDYGQRNVASVMLVSSREEIDARQADYFWVIE